jgi:hypothetical protein
VVWVKLHDRFDEDPKVVEAGPLGVALWVASIAYSNRNLTDGWVPMAMARRMVAWDGDGSTSTSWPDGTFLVAHGGVPVPVGFAYVADVLVRAGLWEIEEGGFRISNYLRYQPSRDAVLALREQAAARQARLRARTRPQRVTP